MVFDSILERGSMIVMLLILANAVTAFIGMSQIASILTPITALVVFGLVLGLGWNNSWEYSRSELTFLGVSALLIGLAVYGGSLTGFNLSEVAPNVGILAPIVSAVVPVGTGLVVGLLVNLVIGGAKYWADK